MITASSDLEVSKPSARGHASPCYAFGDVGLAIRSRDPGWLDLVSQRFIGFETSGAPSFEIELRDVARAPKELCSPFDIYLEPQQVVEMGKGFLINTPTCRSEMDLESRRARVEGPRALYPLDNLLRHLLPFLWQDGLVFHAGAFSDGEEGFITCGPSGAGKSTLMALFGDEALCDELAALRFDDRGAVLHALPFWNARPGSARLRGLFVLRHSREHELRRLSASEAFRRLSSQILWPLDKDWALERTLVNLLRLIEEIPIWDFGFAPRADIRDFVRERF
jgi:hypothetical protein